MANITEIPNGILITDSQCISKVLAKNLKPLIINQPFNPKIPDHFTISSLEGYGQILEIISRLGWVEHTSDWDPGLKITTTTKVIETCSHYFLFDVDTTNLTIIIEDEDPDTDGSFKRIIPIKDIKEIELFGY